MKTMSGFLLIVLISCPSQLVRAQHSGAGPRAVDSTTLRNRAAFRPFVHSRVPDEPPRVAVMTRAGYWVTNLAVMLPPIE